MSKEILIATISSLFTGFGTWTTAKAYYVSDIDKKFALL